MKRPVCVVVGIGPGNGAAIARLFAEEGYAVALVARTVPPVEMAGQSALRNVRLKRRGPASGSSSSATGSTP